ncbi:MAG: hypothetical protein ABSC34_05065 [Acidimicrobiales bacterium]
MDELTGDVAASVRAESAVSASIVPICTTAAMARPANTPRPVAKDRTDP